MSFILSIEKIFDKIKNDYDKFNMLKNIIQHQYNAISLKEYHNIPNLFILINNITQNLQNDVQICICEKNTMKIIVYVYDFIDIHKMSLRSVSLKHIEDIVLPNASYNIADCINGETHVYTYNLSDKLICLFNSCNKWYISYDTYIECMLDVINNNNQNNNIAIIFMELTALAAINYTMLDNTLCYYFIINHPNIITLGLSDDCHIGKQITHLYTLRGYSPSSCFAYPTIDDYVVKVNNDMNKKMIQYVSMDNINNTLEQISLTDMKHKKLSVAGYVIIIKNQTEYVSIKIYTSLYKIILSMIPPHKNQYLNYLELYQKNQLCDVLPYLNKYHYDITRRINLSLKCLAKEILNIYHFTRNRQNSYVYEILSSSYKKTLYDLHHIYVEQKYDEYVYMKTKCEYDLTEKKSITVNIVYSYLKRMQILKLRQLFMDRKIIVSDLKDILHINHDIVYPHAMDIMTLTELLSITSF